MKRRNPPEKKTRLQKFQQRCGFLVFGTLCGLMLGELLLRLLVPQKLSPLLTWVQEPGFERLIVPDPELGWRMAPGYSGDFLKDTKVEINSIGIRDREYSAKKPGQIRILSLGDSYAFGHAVEFEECYAKQLERLLRDRNTAEQIEVVMAGVAGYNTIQELRELDRLVPLVKPDLVVSTFVAGNDVAENAIFERQLATGLQSPVGWLGQSSHLARLGLRASFGPRFFIANRTDANIAFTIQCFQRLQRRLKELQLPVVFMIIPARHQIDPSAHDGAAYAKALFGQEYVFKHNLRMAEHFRASGVPFVDLRSVLDDPLQATYFPDDPHTNAYGHAKIAQALANEVEPILRGLVSAANDSHDAAKADSL